jgi:excisionase family DNA binding protein
MDAHADDRSPDDRLHESLLDINGLAVRLGVTARFVRRLVEERRIPYLKIGRLVRFDPVEVERWIDVARVVPARPVVPRGR